MTTQQRLWAGTCVYLLVVTVSHNLKEANQAPPISYMVQKAVSQETNVCGLCVQCLAWLAKLVGKSLKNSYPYESWSPSILIGHIPGMVLRF